MHEEFMEHIRLVSNEYKAITTMSAVHLVGRREGILACVKKMQAIEADALDYWSFEAAHKVHQYVDYFIEVNGITEIRPLEEDVRHVAKAILRDLSDIRATVLECGM